MTIRFNIVPANGGDTYHVLNCDKVVFTGDKEEALEYVEWELDYCRAVDGY